MKQVVDKHRYERHFAIGDLVFVKLHSYRQVSVAQRASAKLSPRYFGPFQVVDHVGVVAYKIALPTSSRIHNVFHVSQLKRHFTAADSSPTLPDFSADSSSLKEPEAILDRMMVRRRGQAVTKVLVKWKHHLPEDSTWEFYYDLKKRFPSFHP